MDSSFAGKRVLITGAGKGVGRALAIKLAECNAKIIGMEQSYSLLYELEQRIPNLEPVYADFESWTQIKSAVQKVLPIDLLVNTAGMSVVEPISQITEETYSKIMDINVKSVINITQVVVGDLLKRNAPGVIVNISSQASTAGLLNHSLYCTSKGAIDAFTRAAALELGPRNIRINCVNPTVVMTELGKKLWSDHSVNGAMLAKIPLNRFAEVEDVVNAVLFLLSDKANMITGVCLPIDGGFLAG